MKIQETALFTRQAARHLDDLETWDLQLHLVAHPTAGDLIPGGHGLRKLRWGSKRQGRGKRGGLRVIYYYRVDDAILFMSVYPKSERENLTPLELRLLVRVLEEYKP